MIQKLKSYLTEKVAIDIEAPVWAVLVVAILATLLVRSI